MRAALARAETSPATQAAHEVLLVSAAATGHPRYPEFERRMGPEGARRLLIESGIGVLSDRFAQDNPATRPSETTLADAHIKTFNALQSLFHAHGVDRTAESLGALTAKVFARMDKGQQVRVAAGDAGTVAAVVSSVLHGSPQALATRQSELAEQGSAARHRGHRGGLHGALAHGAFARDAFGHIRGDHQSSSGSSSSAGSSRGYAGMGTVWNPSGGIAGLTPNNFIGSPFHQAGLTLPETQELARKYGFTPGNIITRRR